MKPKDVGNHHHYAPHRRAHHSLNLPSRTQTCERSLTHSLSLHSGAATVQKFLQQRESCQGKTPRFFWRDPEVLQAIPSQLRPQLRPSLVQLLSETSAS